MSENNEFQIGDVLDSIHARIMAVLKAIAKRKDITEEDHEFMELLNQSGLLIRKAKGYIGMYVEEGFLIEI